MRAKLLGIQVVDFLNGSGEKISGWNIFTGFEDANVQGLRTEKFFLKKGISLPEDVKLNDDIEISFNYKGKVEKIQKA